MIDSRAKRQNAAAVGCPLPPSILPTGTVSVAARAQIAWTYRIAPTPFIPSTEPRIFYVRLTRRFTVARLTRTFIVGARRPFVIRREKAVFNSTKDPDTREDFVFDWSEDAASDNIASSSWTVTGGLVVVNSSLTTTTTTVRLSGGTLGSIAIATNRVTLTSGQIKEKSIRLTITPE